jgi:pyrroloquinoline quinone biosynthesis protein B
VKIKVLGSAAGGGLPQWNCSCANCAAARSGPNGRGVGVRPRTQTQVAVSIDDRIWTLLNCSPDLRAQIEATPELHSQSPNASRHSPITGAVLTSADIDCVLGLLHLREQQPLEIYSISRVREIIRDNSLFRMLEQKPEQSKWTVFEADGRFEIALNSANGGIACRALATGGDLPYYVERQSTSSNDGAVVGLILERKGTTNTKVAFLPGVREISDELLSELSQCDLLLMDGTFWSDDELIRIQGGGRTAREMGHIPVSGSDGSLERTRGLQRPKRVFIHMNNTNPMVNEQGPEYRQVRDAGWEIAADGMEFVI